MKILVIALSGIGDALMFTPALKKLRDYYPDAQIDVVAMFKGVVDIYSRLPEVNKIHYFDFLNQGKLNSLKFVLSLSGRYNASISVYPANRKEYNIINFMLLTRKRLAVRYKRQDIVNMGFLNNVTIKEDDRFHNVEENIKLIDKFSGQTTKKIPSLNFPLTEDDISFANDYIKQNVGDENKTIIGFHAGCSVLKNHINRRWAPEKFATLARKIVDKLDATVLIFGGPEEKELKEGIVQNSERENVISVETKSLAQSAAVMKHCNVFVTNDSSLMHVSSALGLNVVAIIGPTNTNYIYPWNTNHKIVSLNLECAPCFFYSPKPLICTRTDVKYKCVKEIDVEMVYKNVTSLL